MRIITREGRASLRRMAYEATLRNGALAVMPDVMLGILESYDLMEAELERARQRLANRVESASTPDVPASEEVQDMTDEREVQPETPEEATAAESAEEAAHADAEPEEGDEDEDAEAVPA